ncbi:MAG: hypothetical protein ACM3RX_03930 [Methanococcaceae archaeon]
MKRLKDDIEDESIPYSSRLTITELRSYSGFENISDEEALEIINSFCQLSQISFEVFIKGHVHTKK